MAEVFNLGGVNRCPHCAIASPLLIRYWIGTPAASEAQARPWGAYGCTRCGGVVLAAYRYGYGINEAQPEEVFPQPRSAHEDVPAVARTFLQQALDTLHAPDAAAVMAGSAVDAMLKALGYSKGSVYDRIDQAVADHKLTEGMAAWAHSVRLGANRPRHADEEKPHTTPDEAKQSVDFAEALGSFLFVLTAKISRGIAAAEQASG